jgi:hypothetical protein
MFRSRWAHGALSLTLLFAIAGQARADRDLVGVTQAKFGWSAATGDVVAYRVYLERNGGGFMPHPTTPIKYEGDRVVSVSGSYGEQVRVQVAALSSLEDPEGPSSDPSEWIRFVAASQTPPTDAPPANPPTTPTPPPVTPPPGSGSGGGGDASSDTKPDFDGDGRADLLLREGASGSVVVWTMDGDGPNRSVRTGTVAQTSAIVGNGDYDGDGNADLLSREDATGMLVLRLLADGAIVGGGRLSGPVSPEWSVAASADFDGDGRDDILLRHERKGQLEIWFMQGAQILKRAPLRGAPGSNWLVAGAADFDGDGLADILWYHAAKKRAEVSLIDVRPSIRKSVKLFKTEPDSDVVATGDADGNGLPDVVVRSRATGMLEIHYTELQKGLPRAKIARPVDPIPGSDASLAGLEVQGGGDYDGDENIDLVLRNPNTGDLRMWFLVDAIVVDELRLVDPGSSWVFEGVGAESPATHR